jgi:hypothetical protein
MNYQTGMTITRNGIFAIEDTCRRHPGMRLLMEQALGLGFEGNLEIVQTWTVDEGTRFVNTGLDRRGIPCQWEQTAKEPFIAVQIRNKATGRTVVIKDNCLNPVNRVAAVPLINREVTETSYSNEVDVDVNTEVIVDFRPLITATATAATAPINITFNMSAPSAPLMMMGGANPNFYTIVRDARGFLSVGQVFGGGTRINICNTNVNWNNNTNSNYNNNSNSNSNSSSNAVNLGRPGG